MNSSINDIIDVPQLMNPFGDTPLRTIRKSKGLSISLVASQVGLDVGNLSRIERGLQTPSTKTAEQLALLFFPDLSEIQILYPQRFMQKS
jgi:transcriptional regulator with XRE-family HTH domain